MKKLLLLSGFLFVLAGCGEKTQPITEKPVEEVKKEVSVENKQSFFIKKPEGWYESNLSVKENLSKL